MNLVKIDKNFQAGYIQDGARLHTILASVDEPGSVIQENLEASIKNNSSLIIYVNNDEVVLDDLVFNVYKGNFLK